MKAWLAALSAAAALGVAATALPSPGFPSHATVSLSGEGVVASATLWSLGMRRLAAELAFIRTLVYYGTHPDDYEGHGEGAAEEHGHDEASESYAELLPRLRRVLALDPYWTHPVLWGAGALAFTVDRPDEAILILDEGLKMRPKDPTMLATVAAVGFQQKGDLAQALERLMPVVDSGEAPTMLKNMAAYMNERSGHRDVAARLYGEILNSRDSNYHDNALRGLVRLGVR